MPHRVLITGVSNPLGAEVARRLAPQVPVAVRLRRRTTRSRALEEMDFVHADTRQSVIGKLVRRLRIDTVVHLAVMVDSPPRRARDSRDERDRDDERAGRAAPDLRAR